MIKALLLTAGVCSMINDFNPATYEPSILYVNECAPAEDVDLLARCITAEMGYNQPKELYYLAGSVVWNRMRSDSFPDYLVDVIYQDGQYQCTWNGHIERDADPVAIEVANDLLLNGTQIPENVVFQAEFIQGHGVYEHIGNTYFCYQ